MVRGSGVVGVMAMAVVLVTSACGDIPPPDLGSPPTTMAAEAGVLERIAGVDAEPGGDATPTTAPEAAPPALIIATGSGVAAGPAAGLAPFVLPPEALDAVLAVDDHLGGLVVQNATGEVWWFPGERGSSRHINIDGGALLDVGLRQDTPAAALLVEVPTGEAADTTSEAVERDGPAQRIDLVELVTGTRRPLVTLDPGRSVQDFATEGGISVVLYADDACGGMLVLDADGVVLDRPLPSAPCPVPRRAAFGGVALGPDASTLVFTEVTHRPDGVEQATYLVGSDLVSGDELFRIVAGGPTDRLSSLAFDGQRSVLLRSSLGAEVGTGPILFDLLHPDDPVILGRSDAVSVTFARRPLSVG